MRKVFLIGLGLVIILSAFVLRPQIELPWMLIDDGENLRMGQEISKHFSQGDYSWIFSYEKVDGRFRPAYWLWHYVNFQFFGFNSVAHHFGHLVLFVVISILIYLITQKISKSNLAGLLSSLLFLAFYPGAENYYRLGTAEPPLLLLYLILTYLLTRIYFLKFTHQSLKISSIDYLCFFIILGFMYFMKETAVIFILAFLPIFTIGLIDERVHDKKKWIKFSLIFLAINLFYFILVFGLKNYYGISGGYTEAYKPKIGEMVTRFFVYLKIIFREYHLVLMIPLVAFCYSLATSLRQKRGLKKFILNLDTIQLWQIIFLAWFLLFLLVQSPWLYVMGRYLLPVTIWLAIFLGIEYARIFFVGFKLFWEKSSGNFSLEIPAIYLLIILVMAFFVFSEGRRINRMYFSVLNGERQTQRLISFLAQQTPPAGTVYVNFSSGIMEYQYELPLHFNFFYSRPDIKVPYLILEKQNLFKKGDFVITFKESVSKYRWETIKESFNNIRQVESSDFGPYWKVVKFEDDEQFSGRTVERLSQ
ncbi:MAG: glycosyltransferase family 39 protein [Patescibacteria group bacterium]